MLIYTLCSGLTDYRFQSIAVFDPNLQPDETNAEVQQIHNDYKNLVDYMLGSFMEEMQITPEQFEMACLEGRQQHKDNPFQFHQGLFQQVSGQF